MSSYDWAYFEWEIVVAVVLAQQSLGELKPLVVEQTKVAAAEEAKSEVGPSLQDYTCEKRGQKLEVVPKRVPTIRLDTHILSRLELKMQIEEKGEHT